MIPGMPGSDAAYAALGRFIASWSLVESRVAGVAVLLLGVSEPYAGGMVVSIAPNVTPVINLCQALAPRHLNADEIQNMRDAFKAIEKLKARRNKYAHITWIDATSQDDRLSGVRRVIPDPSSSKPPYIAMLTEVTVESLTAENEQLQALCEYLLNLGALLAERSGHEWPAT